MSLTRQAKDDIRGLCDGIPEALDWWTDQRSEVDGESSKPVGWEKYESPDIVTVANYLDDWGWNYLNEHATLVAMRTFELCMQRELAKRKATT